MAGWAAFLVLLVIASRSCHVAESHDDRTTDSRGSESESVACWDRPGLYLRNRILDAGSNRTWEEYGIRVSGDGCQKCIAGISCQFQLRFASNVYFDRWFPGTREFMILLTGPVLVHASVSSSLHFRGRGSSFDVSYQTWDAGKYILTIDSSCCPDEVTGITASRRLVLLEVEVKEPEDLESVLMPCDMGQVGRWVDTRAVDKQKFNRIIHRQGRIGRQILGFRTYYNAKGIPPPIGRPYLKFQPYECVGELQPLDSFAGALIKRGIREISIVGDSHQRGLFVHLQMLVYGSVTGGLHGTDEYGNREFSVFDPQSGTHLQIRFYWMEGTFRSGEFGCSVKPGKGDPDWPVFSNTSDIVVLGTGAWTFWSCGDPIGSYSHYLPQYMNWAVNLPHKPNTQFFWRTIPPFPSKWFGCSGFVGYRRSSLFSEANRIARIYAPTFGINFLDFWPIDSPRSGDACLRESRPGVWMKDSHYSCMYARNKRVHGVVGEYVARVFVHMLVNFDNFAFPL